MLDKQEVYVCYTRLRERGAARKSVFNRKNCFSGETDPRTEGWLCERSADNKAGLIIGAAWDCYKEQSERTHKGVCVLRCSSIAGVVIASSEDDLGLKHIIVQQAGEGLGWDSEKGLIFLSGLFAFSNKDYTILIKLTKLF